MDIRKRLTIRFSLIVISLFVLFSTSVYFISSFHRQSEFYVRLKNRGTTIAQLLDNVKTMDKTLLQEIDKNTKNALYGEVIYLYDKTNKLVYDNSSAETNYTVSTTTLNEISADKDVEFSFGKNEALGFLYSGKAASFKVVISAYDELGFNGIKSLELILFVGSILAFSCSYILGWIYSGSAMAPMTRIMDDVDKITATALSLRLNEGKKQDEIERLAVTFNKMLDRIGMAFETQKGFISNASHELRTPLTAMKGHVEVTLLRERSVSEYKELLKTLLEDIENLSKISNNLLSLALATTDTGALKFKQIRVDELLFSSREDLISHYPEYLVQMNLLSLPEDEHQLCILGNEQLIRTAFLNLLENGCKYSDNKTVEVSFKTSGEEIELIFRNNGDGIPEAELGQIFRPFYRASNVKSQRGSGLGLALTQKIIELHKGVIEIRSVLHEETTVKVILPVTPSF